MGIESFSTPVSIADSLLNYDKSFSKTTADKVVIPSVEEIQSAYNILGMNALSTTEHLMLRDSHKDYGIYYIPENRTKVGNVQPNNPYLAMRPVIYVKKANFTGEGTAKNPYRLANQ